VTFVTISTENPEEKRAFSKSIVKHRLENNIKK
jgi:hypothetical protein